MMSTNDISQNENMNYVYHLFVWTMLNL